MPPSTMEEDRVGLGARGVRDPQSQEGKKLQDAFEQMQSRLQKQMLPVEKILGDLKNVILTTGDPKRFNL